MNKMLSPKQRTRGYDKSKLGPSEDEDFPLFGGEDSLLSQRLARNSEMSSIMSGTNESILKSDLISGRNKNTKLNKSIDVSKLAK